MRRKQSYLPGKSSIAAHDVFNSFKTPCIETILYPEFSWSNRQANMSGQTMDAENHQLLLTSSPAYHSFLKTTRNYTSQIQRKYQVLFVYHIPKSLRVPESPRPTSPSLTSHVPESHVPESHVPESHVPESHVPESHVPIPLLVTAHICVTFEQM